MPPMTIKDGEYTATVYKMIKEGRYGDAIHILSKEHQKHTKSRAALSLLGYCYYHMQDFTNAAECYEQLTQLHPEVEDYKLYYAQSLYGACAFPEAMKSTFLLDNTTSHTKMIKLQAAIKYGEEDYSGAKTLVEQLPQEDPDYDVDLGCLLYKEGEFEEACKKFMSSMNVLGYQPDLAYNIALCYYSLKQYASALKYIAEIIERGIREHPELSIGMTTEGIDVRSVGNTLILHETALIEAFNLKAAIEYQLKNYAAAQEALTDMPPRSEEELDPVTLHNQALMNMDTKPTEGFEKLAFLLQQNPFPPVTFGNLLLLYCKYEYFDLAADVLAENAHLTYKFLTPYLYEFLDAMITCQTAPEEAFRKFDENAGKLTEQLRKVTKQVQEARHNRDDESLKKYVQDYDEVLEKYIPVLMAQAKIYWNRENYSMVEKIFHKSLEFCNEHDTWKLNVAHVLFMQDNKYKEAIGFYEPIVKKHYENILNVSAIVLANLCVSYIMTSQNEEAEELMRKIEKEEEQISYDDPDKKIFHLCIVNLVIGTLYCAKGNYDFGISRVIKSLEPYNKKLGTDTWFYAKRCFLSLLENMAKHMIMLRDSVVQECIQFLEHCELYGKDVLAIIEQPLEEDRMHIGKNTVTYESRLIKALFYEVTGWNE
ncbi:intraflagellar transport protein 70A [Danio rerio]|uniref:Intraflagellar transport protein 70A n=1 Tax=Danio rerio TaxID=7955 RepID=IT70A_DANRE|nr:intraflagellar transport protein 70A [Danio rerio]A7YE96.2 RecName: Full=Intraflagellar transport protein 70A; AltName: Full=Protein fleer; AltName: Full=Tetratricopeptide repeat protein 30A; Short=TPR repeat protein 30A [Danio rerio]AAI63912.1 Fleer [Danio rerio]|eukprot:NP_001098119.2 tetratricopeptide repeat protein 30A [Danio rerio]